MKKYSATFMAFFSYVSSLKKYFGSKILSSLAFLVLYLNYNTSNNIIRKVIIQLMRNNNELKKFRDVNKRCIDFIVSHREKEAVDPKTAFLSKDVIVSDVLDELLSSAEETGNLDRLMFELFFENENTQISVMFMYFFSEVFKVKFTVLKDALTKEIENINEEEESSIEIDEAMKEYLSIMDGRREDYKLNARKDIKSITWMIMEKRMRTNVILTGSTATGKTSIIKNLAYQIEHKECMPMFYNTPIVRVNLLKIFSNGMSTQELAKKLMEIVKYLLSLQERAGKRIIVFLDDFYCSFAVQENNQRFFYLFMQLFMSNDIIIVTAAPTAEEAIFSKEPNVYKSFVSVMADEPEKKELLDSIKPSVYSLITYYGVNVTDEWIDKAILYSKALNNGSIILETLDLLDVSMANAMLRGRTYLTKEDMLDYYIPEFNMYEEQSEEIKKLVAFHEAGHFVVSRFCKHYTAVYAELITIIPSDEAGGFNRLEYDGSRLKDYGFEFYLEAIAFTLGGRASEEIFIGSISSGAEADLQQATETATSMISTLGLDNLQRNNSIIGLLNRVFIKKSEFAIKGNENLRSEKSINSVSEKVDTLMEKAYNLAIKQLKRHEDYVRGLVELLLREKIVSREDILKREYKGEDGIIRLKVN